MSQVGTVVTNTNLKRQNIIEEAIEYAPISTRHQIVFPFDLEKVNFDITAFEWYYHQANLLGMIIPGKDESDGSVSVQSSHPTPQKKKIRRKISDPKTSWFGEANRKESLCTPPKESRYHNDGIHTDNEV